MKYLSSTPFGVSVPVLPKAMERNQGCDECGRIGHLTFVPSSPVQQAGWLCDECACD